MKIKILFAFCFVAIAGCGLLSKQEVPKETIEADLAKQTVTAKESGLSDGSFTNSDWDFSRDSARCFYLNKDESNFNASDADVSITIASWRDARTGNGPYYRIVYGKLLLHYTKENSVWKLGSIEPKDLQTGGILEKEKFEQFLDLQTPLCKYSRYTDVSDK